MGRHSEWTHVKDLAMVLRRMPCLTQTGLEPTTSASQDHGTDHQATVDENDITVYYSLKSDTFHTSILN